MRMCLSAELSPRMQVFSLGCVGKGGDFLGFSIVASLIRPFPRSRPDSRGGGRGIPVEEYLATTWDALFHLHLLLFCLVNPRIVLACFAV